MRLFELHRHADATGISGTGVVAQGVEFDDGIVVVRWLQKPSRDLTPTTVIHASIASVADLHGHGGSTDIVWVDATYPPAELDARAELARRQATP